MRAILNFLVNLIKRFLPSSGTQSTPRVRRFDSLKMGELISLTGYGTCTITAVWKIQQGVYHWTEYDLEVKWETPIKKFSLEVEYDDGEWLVTLWTTQVELNRVPFPINQAPSKFELEGVTYHLDEKGIAMAYQDEVEEQVRYTVVYADYNGTGDRVFSYEVYTPQGSNERYPEAWIGEDFPAALITL